MECETKDDEGEEGFEVVTDHEVKEARRNEVEEHKQQQESKERKEQIQMRGEIQMEGEMQPQRDRNTPRQEMQSSSKKVMHGRMHRLLAEEGRRAVRPTKIISM